MANNKNMKMIYNNIIMTHQPNKHFKTYKEGLDLEFLREYCMEHGERRTFLRGETLEEAGEPAQWVAFVERGCFKYMVHNDEEGKDYCTGFAFEGEFVSDFPYCLDGDVSEVSIETNMPCEVRVISGQELQALFDNDPKMDVKILKNLFKMVYGRDLDHYRYTRPQSLPSAHRPLSAGGADALAEGHRLVPQHHAHLPEQTTQGDYIRKDIKPNSLPIILLAQKTLN